MFEPGDQGGTFNGGPPIGAVMLAVLQTVAAPAFLEQVRQSGEHLRAGSRALAEKHGHGEVRGRGLLLALALNLWRAEDRRVFAAARPALQAALAT